MSSDAFAAMEQRCLQMVIMAESKAAEQRRELENRVHDLEHRQVAMLEQLDADVLRCTDSLDSTAQLLSAVSAEFASAHGSSDKAIRRLIELRSVSETSAFQRIKVAIAEFRDYRHQMKKSALWRIAQSHKDSLILSSSAKRDTDAGANFGLFGAEHELLTELAKKFEGAVTTHETDEVPFMLDAVYAYLIGAIESLSRFGDVIAGQLCRAAKADEQLRRTFLLNEERAVLRRNASKLAPAQAQAMITPDALALVLVKRLADERENRNEAVHRLMADACAEGLAAAATRLNWCRDVFRSAASRILTAALMQGAVSVTDDGSFIYANGGQQQHQQPHDIAVRSSGAWAPPGDHGGAATAATAAQMLARFAAEAEGRVFCKLLESNQRQYEELRGNTMTLVDELRRKFHHNLDLTVHHDVTVFSLEQLEQETERRMLFNRVTHDRFATLERKHRAQLQGLQDQVTQLTSQVEELRAQRADAARHQSELERELERTNQLLQLRHRAELVLRTEVRQINYEVNMNSFGESWQESLLNLRSRILEEIRDENLRFIARVGNLIRTHMGDESQLEQLYEVRLRTVLEETERDNQRKLAEARRRFAAERQLLHDEMEQRLATVREDAAAEKREYKLELDRQYEAKVIALNELYDHRVRQVQARTDDAETFFGEKLKELHAVVAQRTNQLEIRSAMRDVAVDRQYEQEAAQLKRAMNDREHVLEAERMKVMTSVESKIHEKVMGIRVSFDNLIKQLQDTVFAYLEQQQAAFEEQRAKEHIIFSHFMFGSIRFHQETGRLEMLEVAKRGEQEAVDSIKRNADNMFQLQWEHEAVLEKAESTHTSRSLHLKNVQEQMLRKTQELRCEQESSFWRDCNQLIARASRMREEGISAAQRLMQERYVTIVQQVNQYLQNDVMAAHQTFERECRLRQSQLQGWVNHFHKITLHMDSMLWLEVCGRAAIEKEYYSHTAFMRLIMVEERRAIDYCADLDAAPFADLRAVTFDDVEEVRRKYERYIEAHREQSANMSHDYLTAISASLREQQHEAGVMSGIFCSRLEALAVALKDRFAVYTEARDYAINKELQRIVESVQSTLVTFVREGPADDTDEDQDTNAGDELPTSSSNAEPQPDGGVRTPRRASPAGAAAGRSGRRSSPRRRARSAGPSHHAERHEIGTLPSTGRMNITSDGGANHRRARDAVGTAHKQTPQSPPSRPRRSGAQSRSTVRQQQEAEQHQRLVEYFAGLRALLVRAFDDMDTRIQRATNDRDALVSRVVKRVHDEYLVATASSLKRLEAQQHMIDERDSAIVQLASRVETKAAAEVQAAVLAEDLAVLAHKYDLLSRGWMLHATLDENLRTAARRDVLSDDDADDDADGGQHEEGTPGPLSPGGVIKRHFAGDQKPAKSARVLLAFVSDIGGKRATRNAVLENIQMRERLVAQEWFGDDLLRDGMFEAAMQAAETDRANRRRRSASPRSRPPVNEFVASDYSVASAASARRPRVSTPPPTALGTPRRPRN